MIKYNYVITGLLFLPAVPAWIYLFRRCIKLRRQFKEKELFYQKHNCVVMYNREYMSGWPPDYQIKITTKNLDTLLEPYLFFINTAKHELLIAMMKIGIDAIFTALHKAHERGVKVRIIVDFLSVINIKEKFRELLKAGIEVVFFVDKSEKKYRIMHLKYMVKDYSSEEGHICMGSLNVTSLSVILKNYEDITFSSSHSLVKQFHKNFHENWDLINKDNQDPYNRTRLMENGFLQ